MTHRSIRARSIRAAIDAVAVARRVVCHVAVRVAQVETALIERWKTQETRDAMRATYAWYAGGGGS